jgi:hypothetical protein
MRRLESQLVQALPRDGLRRDRSTSSSSSASSSRPGGDRARAPRKHCRPCSARSRSSAASTCTATCAGELCLRLSRPPPAAPPDPALERSPPCW